MPDPNTIDTKGNNELCQGYPDSCSKCSTTKCPYMQDQIVGEDPDPEAIA